MVLDQDRDVVGRATEAFTDDGTEEPEFLVVVNPSKPAHLVPLAEAVVVGEGEVQVPYTKDTIETAPAPGSDRVSEDDVRRLIEHYGLRSGA